MKTKFDIRKENYGYTIQPTSFKLREKLEKHLKEMGGYPSASFFFQSLGEVKETLELSPRHIGDLIAGCPITILRDAWEILHIWGWDSHTIVE